MIELALGNAVNAAWLLVTGWTIGHALLRKTDPASAWGWIVTSLLLPFAGPALYWLFGINRVRTRARRRRKPRARGGHRGPLPDDDARRAGGIAVPASLGEVARTGDAITGLPLLAGNGLRVLHDGEQAYPRMLAAIDGAQQSIALMSYIFEPDTTGQQFIEALARAQARGVAVRCLLDGLGELGWPPRSGKLLESRGISVARFNPLRLWPPLLHGNLRNHRKLLLVDGRVGYAGGMNLCDDHLVARPGNPMPTTDLHVELRGPVLRQLQEIFEDDWAYASGARSEVPPLPEPTANTSAPDEAEAASQTTCRVITDGPNEDYGFLTMVLLSAIAAATRRIVIVTPYFVPPEEILTALLSAALRGVVVDVILSRNVDHRITHWATLHLLPRLLERGVRIWYQPPPFCHTKLIVIDDLYTQFGSANLDARSLKLNFELMVEVYDQGFARRLAMHAESLRLKATRQTAEALRRRPLLFRLRDAACWLFSPYL